MNENDETLTVEQACELLGVRKNTLYQYTSKKKIPFSKPAGKLYFKRSELIAWKNGEINVNNR